MLTKKLELKHQCYLCYTKADLCDFSDAYIVVKEVIALIDPDEAKRKRCVELKLNALFINCFSKINGVQIGNA